MNEQLPLAYLAVASVAYLLVMLGVQRWLNPWQSGSRRNVAANKKEPPGARIPAARYVRRTHSKVHAHSTHRPRTASLRAVLWP